MQRTPGKITFLALPLPAFSSDLAHNGDLRSPCDLLRLPFLHLVLVCSQLQVLIPASTPHCGAGAGMAIEDALIMSRAMGLVYDSKDIPRAFAAFEKVRKHRSQRLVKNSRESGLLYDLQLPGCDDWEKVKQRLPLQQAWIWDEDIEAEIRDAEEILRQEVAQL